MSDTMLNQKWTAGSHLCFAFPTLVMMIFMGLYTVVDTVFVAQFVNTDALSAVNIVCPVVNLTVGLGTMLATGGNAIVSRKMGACRNQEANEDFTLLIITGAVMGFLLLLAGTVWLDKIIYALGASDRLFLYCKDYLAVLLLFIPANILQTLFSNLFVTAGKPGLGLGLSVLAGVANIILDYIFIVPLGLGIRGAALGTGFGYLIPAVAGLAFFMGNKQGLSFAKPKLKWDIIGESCFNGSSEMVSQLATAVTTFLFNRTMMGLLGEDGVAAVTIIMYVLMFASSLYTGYSYGVAPMVSYYYGEQNQGKLKNLVLLSLKVIMGISFITVAASFMLTRPLVSVFARPDNPVYDLAVTGNRICTAALLFIGFNIFASGMFTALSNGAVSAILAFSRSFVFMLITMIALPLILGINGIWLATPAAELMALALSVFMFFKYRKKYGY